MHKVLLAIAALAGVLTLASGAASARDYPYCLLQSGDYGPGNCIYSTLQQCRASASGIYADCNINPRFAYGQYGEPRRSRGNYGAY